MKLTRPQMETIKKKWNVSHDGAETYLKFRRRVYPGFMGGYVVLPWCKMAIAIEADGYPHT